MIKRILFSIMLFITINEGTLYCQSLNFPVDSLYGGRYNIGVYGEYFFKKDESLNFSSLRGLSQLEIGIFRRFSVYGIFGLSGLSIDYPELENITDFEGNRGFTIGGGVKLNVPVHKNLPLKVFCYGGGLRFKSKGDVRDKIEKYYLKFDFDWREFWGGIGTIIHLKKLDFITGYEGKSLQRIELMREDEYVSGLFHTMFIGMNITLPERTYFRVQAKLFGEYSFSLGVCQLSR